MSEGTESKVIELRLSSDFARLLESVRREHPTSEQFDNVINEPVLALDPGETTGVAEFDGDQTIRVYQRVTKDIGPSYDWLTNLIKEGPYLSNEVKVADGDILVDWIPFKHLRYEDYRVYEWKTSDHAWSPVHTIRWIGAIQVAAHSTQMPSSCIMASHAKSWWTDSKLDHFGLNPKGLKHGRDALRHLLYFLLFPDSGQHAAPTR